MRLRWTSLLALCANFPGVVALGPWAQYVTEPTIKASMIKILDRPENMSVLDPGYIFITPYVSDYRVGSFGPHIFTNEGELIWNGNHTSKIRAMDAHVCDYLGEKGTHICYNDAKPVEQAGHSAGLIRFFNNKYEQVGPDYGADGDLRAPDIHELNTPGQDGQTFIQDIYEIRQMDLRDYKGPERGFVLDGCFQEIDMATKNVVFQWCALDYMPIYDTYMYLQIKNSGNYSLPIAGTGVYNKPWDFFHINAIAKNLEGDYAVSGRHMNTIYKIAGKNNKHNVEPGTILWRLGGKHNDFKLHGFNFSRQHTVRFKSTGPTETVISLFDNAFDGFAQSADYSSGKLIKINNSTKEAWLMAQYDSPDQKHSFSQGSMQLMDNGNVFMGWGNRHFFSEYTADGKLLYHASYSGGVETFRAWKFPWKGYPQQPPKVLSYAMTCDSKLYAYVSWNGATEVTHWRFYISRDTKMGPWHDVGTFEKKGFETTADFSANRPVPGGEVLFAPFVYAEALDKHGKVIGKSKPVDTFVPKDDEVIKKFHCNATMCGLQFFQHASIHSCAWQCRHSYSAAIFVFAFSIVAMELINYAITTMFWRHVDPIGGFSPIGILSTDGHRRIHSEARSGPGLVAPVVSSGSAPVSSGNVVSGFSNLLALLGLARNPADVGARSRSEIA